MTDNFKRIKWHVTQISYCGQLTGSTWLVYVVHTEKPRCIIQCDLDGFYSNQKIYWTDEEPLSQDDIDSLMEEAEDFYETELDNQEEVYDEEEDN